MKISHHCFYRSYQRKIPRDIIDPIVKYGEAIPAKDGAYKMQLTTKTLLFNALNHIQSIETRKRLIKHCNTTVVINGEVILTVY